MNRVSVWNTLRSVFNEGPARQNTTPDRLQLEEEVARAIHRELTAIIGYPAPFTIRPRLEQSGPCGVELVDLYIVPERSAIEQADVDSDTHKAIKQMLKDGRVVRLSAIYSGIDGSMGFRRGRLYYITVSKGPNSVVNVKTEEGLLRCPYSSLSAMLRYWKPLRIW